ncbi:Aldo-ket-red domain-containing protein [Aphelenchoides bicaudatus]|nr:Aldo-ket-red domain-containing protein [Aphelenchoides bicaudatus]
MANVGFIEQSNGTKLPRLGLGTWLASDHEELKQALRHALDAGYRYIGSWKNTAAAYGNEAAIGDVLQEYYDSGKLKREDVFIATKLPFYAHEPSVAEEVLARSLKNLRTDHFDLYLMHTPLPFKPKADHTGPELNSEGKFIPIDVPLIDTWRVLEKHFKNGTLKSIGVSNFNADQLKDLYEKAEVKPHNLQIELHVLHPQKDMLDLCKQLKISVTSYSTLGSPGRGKSPISQYVEGDCLNHAIVQEIAKKHYRTPAQILLRHTIQQVY